MFTHAFPSTAYATYGHLENEYIETVVEFGIPGAIALAIVLGWCIVTGLRKWRDGPLVAAALGGLAAVAKTALEKVAASEDGKAALQKFTEIKLSIGGTHATVGGATVQKQDCGGELGGGFVSFGCRNTVAYGGPMAGAGAEWRF